MQETYMSALAEMGASLTTLAVKGTATAINIQKVSEQTKSYEQIKELINVDMQHHLKGNKPLRIMGISDTYITYIPLLFASARNSSQNSLQFILPYKSDLPAVIILFKDSGIPSSLLK